MSRYDLDSVATATDAAAEHFGRIDVVIAKAGVGSIAPLESMTPEFWERVIDINLSGVWRTFRAALPHVKQHRGYLLAVSSMAAFVHSPLNGPYVASKAGVWALRDATRLELRHHGVGVGSAHPTFFKTPLEDVVDAAVRGIERRADMIVPGRENALAARIPGIIRPLVERIGFRGTTIPDAIAQATAPGRLP